MPLRDHFGPTATAGWEDIHGIWPGQIAIRLNAVLPPKFRGVATIHIGSPIEVDVGTFEQRSAPAVNGDAGLGWEAGPGVVLLDADELAPPEFAVRVYNERFGRRLVAAVELVSPGNKDRPSAREAFVSKCHALLAQGVCVAVVDVISEGSGNLFVDLARRLGAAPAAPAADVYAVCCRPYQAGSRFRIDVWQHPLAVGDPLPTLPLWISDDRYVPLELERTYEETCRGLRIP